MGNIVKSYEAGFDIQKKLADPYWCICTFSDNQRTVNIPKINGKRHYQISPDPQLSPLDAVTLILFS
jgi:hypothetical protein